MTTEHIELPKKLKNRQLIESTTGVRCRICRTGKKDAGGNLIYRVRFQSGLKGHGTYTRDDLQADGVKLIKEEAA